MFRRLSFLFVWIVLFGTLASTVSAQQASRERVNRGVVGLVSGGVNGTYIQVASDLASVLDDGENLRVLPMIGKGSIQNIADLLYLRGVDMAVVQSDVLSYLNRERIYGGIKGRVKYIAKLYNEEFHLLAANGINTVQDLAGKKVNFGGIGSGTYMTASTVFGTLGVEVEPTSFDQALALEKLRRGEIAGMVYVAGKPARLFANAKSDGGVHFLKIPYTPELAQIYLPSVLTSEDYPGLIPAGGSVETAAVGAVLAVFNWNPEAQRYRNLQRFTQAFFSRFSEFQKPPRHKKWQEVSLSAQVPGWVRFKPAADWLRAQTAGGGGGGNSEAELRASFQQFLSEVAPGASGTAMTDKQKGRLFGEFIRWQRQKAKRGQ